MRTDDSLYSDKVMVLRLRFERPMSSAVLTPVGATRVLRKSRSISLGRT